MSRSSASRSTVSSNQNNDPQSAKRDLIRKARTTAAKSAGRKKNEAVLIEDFTGIMYERVAAEDLNKFDADTLAGAATSLWNFAQGPRNGSHKIRVYNPVAEKHGWHIPRTVVEIVNDDMPFIIDSISQEMARRELNIHLLVHPVLRISRNKAGKITELADTDDAPETMATESMIHLEIGQLLTLELREDLEAALSHILDDVRAATADWQPVLAKLRHAIGEVDTSPAPVKPEELDEAKAFLRYMHDDNFTLLGYREYSFAKEGKTLKSEVVPGSGLGILRNDKRTIFEHPLSPEGLPTQIEALEMQAGIIVVNKLNLLSTVHRRVPLDAVSLKLFDADGNLCGEKLFVGLFTSVTYSRSVTNVPFLRKKVAKIHELAGFRKNTHDNKALTHILEKYPRDELFQITIPKLLEIVLGILRLQERPHLALFTRRDHFERFVSCLIYVPREQYKTELRRQMQEVLELEMDGKCTNFYTTLDDSPLARVLFFISTRPGKVPDFDAEAIQVKLTAIATAWPERLRGALIKAHGDDKGIKLAHKYARAFSTEYTEKNGSKGAVFDIAQIEDVIGHDDNRIGLDLYTTGDTAAGGLNLKIYHLNTPVPLSDMLPMLENMGLRVISEQPFNVTPAGTDSSVWVHDFNMTTAGGEEIDVDAVKDNFENALSHIWAGKVENDGFNRLALTAGLNSREVTVLRAYARFLRQAGYVFGQRYIEQVLAEWSHISRAVVELFLTMHDPALVKKSGKGPDTSAIEADIEKALEEVSQLDHDRILRSYLALVKATLRTNYFQTNDDDGKHKDFLSFKFDSAAVEDLPQPRPLREIFVYSPRMEGVHLRGGLIARGGIRWSDRPEDFRTEILGLMKAQMVKNSVIVPVGAKGGFILKQPPKTGGRDAFLAEGIACYKMLVRALLDITDNNKGGKVVHPKNVVRHDGDDPYLVVAADKGTATFSDIANEIAEDYGFWLGDAFASGGSSGYDHKKMGITARGAWESVKRHFREMGTDIQSEDFDVVGVGDMGGDVFGNGMLLSKHIRLVGAFNHLHIFCDPTPDPAESFKERQRLFKAVKGWDAYDTKKLSKGGRIYERSAKSLDLTPEIRKAFGITKAKVTPAELVRAMLRAEVDLLWFGGIGTYIKSSDETHAAAGDKANDSLRVDANEINARVIGEGANLGVTQKGRIEFGIKGGRLNTDFIDNSGGVDASDHEVNIKILLSDVMSSSKSLNRASRDKLLVKMTDEVAGLVLANNYRQGQCISLAQSEGAKKANLHMQFVRDMEREGIINRKLEGLPDDETVEQRLRKGLGLTRPELSVLISYAKILLFNELLESKLSDEDTVVDMLMGYFPKPLQKDYATQIKRHKLRREIISTELANSVVNRLGPVFVKSRMETTGASACDIVRGYVIAREVLGLTPLWVDIEALDNKAPSKAQIHAMSEAQHMAERAITWFIVNRIGKPMDVAAICDLYGPGIKKLLGNLAKVLGPETRERLERRTQKLNDSGLPASLAKHVAAFPVMGSAFDVVRIADECKGDILATAEIYFGLGEKLHFGWLRDQAEHMASDDHWQSLALSGLVDDFYACQSALTKSVIDEMGTPKKDGKKLLDAWFEKHDRMLRQIGHVLGEVSAIQHMDLSMLTVAEQRLRALAGRKDAA